MIELSRLLPARLQMLSLAGICIGGCIPAGGASQVAVIKNDGTRGHHMQVS